ncbi:CotO family spore coat protein [Anoxybacteroides tepidamans]|uniref:CotO family spore coat protein n=1 Tax=Anoxybacteroides tepidamans TaxID=265948 RepID=UPI000485A01C|nr:CotO family spore coat protein [Anoxybacillus tepidamans]
MKQAVPNEPLLYIVQPKLEPKVSYMQQSFQAKKYAPQRASKGKRGEDEQKSIHSKQFQEMTLEEQIQFLTKLPNQLSKIKCKLTTKKGEHKGFVLEYKNGHVRFQIEKGKQINIPFNQIISVSLIGFGKEH